MRPARGRTAKALYQRIYLILRIHIARRKIFLSRAVYERHVAQLLRKKLGHCAAIRRLAKHSRRYKKSLEARKQLVALFGKAALFRYVRKGPQLACVLLNALSYNHPLSLLREMNGCAARFFEYARGKRRKRIHNHIGYACAHLLRKHTLTFECERLRNDYQHLFSVFYPLRRLAYERRCFSRSRSAYEKFKRFHVLFEPFAVYGPICHLSLNAHALKKSHRLYPHRRIGCKLL